MAEPAIKFPFWGKSFATFDQYWLQPPRTCSNSSHSWLAEGPIMMSDKAEACAECEVVTSAPWLFVSSVKTVQRNCSATVWRRGPANLSFTHTDNVPADKVGT